MRFMMLIAWQPGMGNEALVLTCSSHGAELKKLEDFGAPWPISLENKSMLEHHGQNSIGINAMRSTMDRFPNNQLRSEQGIWENCDFL